MKNIPAWDWYIPGADTSNDNRQLFSKLKEISDRLSLNGYKADEQRSLNDHIFNLLREEAGRTGVLYQGRHFSDELGVYAFFESMRNGWGRGKPKSLTVFRGVAKAFACPYPGTRFKVVLSIDPSPIELRGVNYLDRSSEDYEPI
ncbi:MAG: hypothetical protein QW292_09860, partial [Candidatus Parvarchaeota archaeon]